MKYVSLLLIAFAFIMGCTGKHGNFKRQTRSESKATKQQLIHNWSDYDIWLHHNSAYKPPRITIIIFDPKNNDRKISVGNNWRLVKDQQMWTEIVKANTASDGELTLVWQNYGHDYYTGVHEILGLDNQFYGFIIYQQYAVSLQRVEQIDENSIRISWSPPRAIGGR